MSDPGCAMDTLNQVLLKDDIRVGADLDAWLARGGGEGLANALRDPDAIIRDDRGRRTCAAWAAPASRPIASGRRWPRAPAGDKYIICNGNEDEPGTFKDRFLLEHTPHQVIEGALIAAVATRANHVVLYVNPHEQRGARRRRARPCSSGASTRCFAAIERCLGAPGVALASCRARASTSAARRPR